MGHTALVLLAGIAIALVAGWFWRRGRAAQLRARQQLACMQFADMRSTLADVFLQSTRSTGIPRGLNWESCQLSEDEVFATDRVTGELYALVGATISFSAIPGGGMEDVEAVGNLRYATAIFVHKQGTWQSDGKVMFNLEPRQAVEHYDQSLSLVAAEEAGPAKLAR